MRGPAARRGARRGGAAARAGAGRLPLCLLLPGRAQGGPAGDCGAAGVAAHSRCWYLSDAGATCSSTCSRHRLQVSWLAAPEDAPLLPRLLGFAPATRQAPWAALECYVPGEDRYHTAHPAGKGAEDPAGWSYPTCRLACPCEEPPPPAEGAARLAGSPSPAVGRLEVFHAGAWGTVCGDSFSIIEAQVVCEQLGYYGGFPTGADEFGAAGGPVWLSSLGCAGSEAALGACPHAGWGANSCSHSQDVGVACAEAMTIQDQVRGLIRSQEQPSKCWRGGYIPNFCCHPALGPGGNHVCWGQQGGGRAAALAAGDCCNESTWTALEVTSYHQVLQMEWQRRCDAEREVPIYDGRPEEWMGALSQELLYWFGWLRQGAYGVGRRPDRAEFLRDTDPAAPLDARVRGLLLRARAGWPWPWSTRARVLNIGSGALNGVGHEWPGVDVEVVPADALACEYAQMRKDLGIRVRVPPVPAEVEGLVQRFGGGSFDAAFGSNFLDHAHDPVAGVRQMVLSVRRGGRVLLSHRRNEGESQSYVALHQWNIDAAPALGSSAAGGGGPRLRIWRPAREGLPAADHDVGQELAGEAEVQVALLPPRRRGEPEMVEAELVRL